MQIHSMLPPSWLVICLLEDICRFLLGLVTGAWEINWEGLHTLSKKEKRNQSISQRKRKQIKAWKKLKLSLFDVTFKIASFILSQFQNNVLNATESSSFRYFSVAYGAIICLYGVNRQPSNGLTVQVKINRQNVSRCFKSHYISADLHGIPAPKEFLNWENQLSCSKHPF